MADPQKSSSPVPIDRPRAGEVVQAELFRSLIESVPDYAIFVLDREGNILTWNPRAQAMKGYTKDEIVGENFSKFYLPEAVESGWPQHKLALAQKEGRFADEGWPARNDGASCGHPSS